MFAGVGPRLLTFPSSQPSERLQALILAEEISFHAIPLQSGDLRDRRVTPISRISSSYLPEDCLAQLLLIISVENCHADRESREECH